MIEDRSAEPAEEDAAPAGIAAKTAGFEKREGLLTLHLDRKAGKVFLEVPAADPNATPGVRSWVDAQLAALAGRLKTAPGAGAAARAHSAFLAAEIGRHLERERTETPPPPGPPTPPPGSPIGAALAETLAGCSYGR